MLRSMLATFTDFVGCGQASPQLLMNATNLPDLLIFINMHAQLVVRFRSSVASPYLASNSGDAQQPVIPGSGPAISLRRLG